MDGDPKTLARHLEQLGRQSRVSPSFIAELRRILQGRGISLQEDSGPYRKALEEAVRREEELNRVALRTRQSLSQVQHRLDRLGEICRLQLRQLKALRNDLRRRTAPRGVDITPTASNRRRSLGGRKRLYVVPGPRDIQ